MALPKGLSEVKYQTKIGEVVKYRLRIKTKEFSFNKVFETLELAEEALNLSKTIAGRKILENAILGIQERDIEEEGRQKFAELLTSETLRVHLPNHYELHLKKPEIEDKDKKNNKVYKYMISAICNTEIPNYVVEDKQNPLEKMLKNLNPIMSKTVQQKLKKLGDFSIFEITEREILLYINKRLETVKKSTVKRELAFLSGFFARVSLFGEKYKSIENPVQKCLAKTNKLDGAFIKRDRRLEEGEEDKLYKALSEMRNPDMLKIVILAHDTGLRRSEILGLKWSQIKDCYKTTDPSKSFIRVYKGKNQEPRYVKVFSQGQIVIDSLEQKTDEEKVFNYTIEGFKTNMTRAIKKAGLVNFRFHDLRAELISKLFEAGFNSVIVANLANIDNQNYFDSTHKKIHDTREMLKSEVLTDEQIRMTGGHKNKNAQRGYVRLSKEVIGKINQLKNRDK
ncbi:MULTISPECIES: site-specific integrase [Ralstonia]|uniref:site-specific integrase n=1 Tax=Ralstonia mannitolilytica TaxID=105219 RepID=UPI001C95EDD5|nr:site-specific integrase [Ralstonia mannitolilytica]MBY4720419.1 site-specific integrase [Ralstonia mannitolilytica]